MNPLLFPIGTQTFSVLREGGYLYVDKTDLVYKMTHDSSRYVFLSRPRRFGKSLLVSTLMSYFEGRMELFEGLAMEQIDIKNYPERFAQYGLPITKVALNFDSETRNISEWLIEELKETQTAPSEY